MESVQTHNTTGRETQHLGIHERVGGTTHRTFESHNGGVVAFSNNFKHLMMIKCRSKHVMQCAEIFKKF
jgi:hypothetical protein